LFNRGLGDAIPLGLGGCWYAGQGRDGLVWGGVTGRMPVPPCLLGRGPIVGWGAQSRWDWGGAGTEGKAGTGLFGEGSQAGCPCHLACWGAGQSWAGGRDPVGIGGGLESGLLGEGERGKRLKGRERGVGVPWIRGVRGLLWGERVITEGLPRDRENRAAKINQPARNLT